MKIDKELLRKHQFWVLLLAAVVLWAACLSIVFLGPARSAAAARADYEKTQKTVGLGGSPKNETFLPPWNEYGKYFADRKSQVWEEASRPQQDLMTWPGVDINSELKNASFGDLIPAVSIQRYKDGGYASQFKDLRSFLSLKDNEDLYFPVAYDRKIYAEKTWTKFPTNEECWLAQEEIWVRREVFNVLTEALRSIGTFKEIRETNWEHAVAATTGPAANLLLGRDPKVQAARYKERPAPPEIARSKLFRNHSWEVELLLEKDQVNPKSTLKNINRFGRSMPLINDGKGLLLRIRQGHVSRPLARIDGKLLAANATVTFNNPTSLENIDINRDFVLEEVFEPATSPIKRLDALEVGATAQPHLLAVAYKLVPNKLAPKPPPPPQATQGFGNPDDPEAAPEDAGDETQPPPQPVALPVPPFTENNNMPRMRYAVATDQVRRIPVAFTVVMDQTHRNEVLVAVANSRLRIQISQVYWRQEPAASVTSQPAAPPPRGVPGKDKDIAAEKSASEQSEANRNLIALNVHGIATLYDRFKPTAAPGTPEQPEQPQNPAAGQPEPEMNP